MSQRKNQSALKSVLRKYLDGKATPQECEAINHWYDNLGNESESTSQKYSPFKLNKVSKLSKNYLIKQAVQTRKFKHQYQYIKYAAILLLFTAIGFTFYQKFQTSQTQKQEIVFKSSEHAAKEVILKDGSTILLNTGSELRVAGDFGNSERTVRLNGEAFFKISKDKRKPFIIHTGIIRTVVVGTSFNINAYANLDRIKIAVVSGIVKVFKKSKAGDVLIGNELTKDATLTFYKTSGNGYSKVENAELISSWRQGKLYIDNATIGDIAKQLERYYQVKVVYNPNMIQNKRFTIRFNQEPANRVMEILSLLTKTKFTFQTNQITIK